VEIPLDLCSLTQIIYIFSSTDERAIVHGLYLRVVVTDLRFPTFTLLTTPCR